MITFYHDTEQDFGIDVDPEACRQVVAEFLQIEKRYGISSTYNVVGKIYQEQPTLIEQIDRGGGEVAFHSYHHTYEPDEYYNEIALCRQLSATIRGYRSPRSQWNECALQALCRHGFVWSAENDRVEREPYFIRQELVRLPIAGDDWTVHLGQLSEKQWVNSFDRLMSERRYFGFGTHDSVVSLKPDVRLKAYERLIQVALTKRALIVNFSEAADLYIRASLAGSGQESATSERSDSIRPLPLTAFKFKIGKRERDASVKSIGRYVPASVRKALRKLPYFKSL